MKEATLVLSTLAIGLISVTPSFAQSAVSGAGVRLVGLWGSTRPHNEPLAIPAWAGSLTGGPVPNAASEPA